MYYFHIFFYYKTKTFKYSFIKTGHLHDFALHWQLCNRSYLDINQEYLFYKKFLLSSAGTVDKRQLEKKQQALYNIKRYNEKQKRRPPKTMGLLKEVSNGDTLSKKVLNPDFKCYEKINRTLNTFKE